MNEEMFPRKYGLALTAAVVAGLLLAALLLASTQFASGYPSSSAGSAAGPGTILAVASYIGQPGYELPIGIQAYAYLPSVRRGSVNTSLFVQNTVGVTAHITVTFHNSDGAVVLNIHDDIPPHGSHTYDQATIFDLPAEFEGSATIVSDQPILAVANVRPAGADSLLSYNGVQAGATEVVLPSIMRNWYSYDTDFWVQNAGPSPANVWRSAGPWAAAYNGIAEGGFSVLVPRLQKRVNGWFSATKIMNMGTTHATVTCRFYRKDGSPVWTQVSRGVPPTGHVTCSPLGHPEISDGFDGTLEVVADQPLAVLANWQNPDLVGDGLAMNTGINRSQLQSAGLQSASHQIHLPRVAHLVAKRVSTQFSIQNAGEVTATAMISYYHESGMVTAVVTDVIPAHGVARYATWDMDALNESWQGSVTISANQPIAVEAMQFLSQPPPSRIYLPLITRLWPPIPDTPALHDISNPDGDGNYTVSWSPAARADSYTLQEDTDSSFPNPLVVYSGAGTSTTVMGRGPGTYYYRVKATNSWGDSAWSQVKSVTVAPPARIVFQSDRDGASPDIYSMNSDGSGVIRLTNYPEGPRTPGWSPDQTQIAWVGYINNNIDIYVMNAEGSNVRRLTFDNRIDESPAWSPDGARIAFYRVGPPSYTSLGVFVINVDGSNERLLIPMPAYDPAWSPDGTRIAFAAGDLLGGSVDIYVAEVANPSNVVRLTSSALNFSPDWSPDGRQLAFESNRDGNYEIYVMDANGQNVRRLTNHSASDNHPSWSPAGQRIVFQSKRDGNWEIYVMNADGSSPVNLTNNPAVDAAPDW